MVEIITTVVTVLTIAPIVLGFLLGLLRGRNRSILRFVLVIGCAVAAFFVKDAIVPIVLKLNINGETVEQMVMGIINESGQIPAALNALVLGVVKVIIGLVVFLVLFIVLQLLTWLIVFPILKIFVRKGAKKGALFGGIVGIIQGVVVAFVLCAPVTGAVTTINKVAKMEIGGKTVAEQLELPEFDSYINSTFGQVYSSTGSWFFDAITTYTDEEGKEITLDSTVQAADTGVKVLQEVNKIQETIKELNNPESEKSQADSLRDIAASLSNMGTAISETSDGGKEVLQQLITSVGEMVDQGSGEGSSVGSETSNKVNEALSKLDIETIDLESMSNAISGIADYVDKAQGVTEEVPEQAKEDIVNALVDHKDLVGALVEGDGPLVTLADEDVADFEEEINKRSELTEDEKNQILQLLGR